MKLTATILLISCLHVFANGFSQGAVTLNEKGTPLSTIFEKVKRQTGMVFWFRSDQLENAKPVTIHVENVPLIEALDKIFEDQPLSYIIKDKRVFVKTRETEKKVNESLPPINIKGRVVNERSDPVEGVTVRIKASDKSTVTDANGEFTLFAGDDDATLVFTHVSMETFELKVSGKKDLVINLKSKISILDEMQVIAYGSVTKRMNTGNVSTVKAEEIQRQPVSNPLAALSGRVAGMTVTQNSGLPGSPVNIEIRGRTSLPASVSGLGVSNDPLFIIDGIPFAPNNLPVSKLTSALGTDAGLSPFSLLNPSEIESIDVLKDADATAIYGSRGANGVVLITTKKGKTGKTQVQVNYYSGISKVTRTMDFLNTEHFRSFRKEAFANDNVVPNPINAPDLLVFDSSRYTNFTKSLIGGTAKMTNIETSLSGGNANTQFLLGVSYRRETTVYPGDMFDRKGSLHLNINHSSVDRKLSVSYNGIILSDYNKLTETDLTTSINLAPNYPELIDGNGNLVWSYNGRILANPYSYLKQSYLAKSENFLNNVRLSYLIFPWLTVSANSGLNMVFVNETKTIPKSSENPVNNPQGRLELGKSNFKTWIFEPQIEFKKDFNRHVMSVVAGYEWQKLLSDATTISAAGFVNDALINNVNAASAISPPNNLNDEYKYAAAFGRINYNYDGKYLINFSGRRDGSSRFGPGKQFANFGAVGAAWIFSNEKFLDGFPLLSFGKLRASYGITGNDKLPNYLFLPAWSSTDAPYQGTPGLTPKNLFNPDYSWEVNRKLEAGLELGLLKDRIIFSTSYYRNRSSNQLIYYPMPSQSGFPILIQNLNALIENAGFEFDFNSKIINKPKFKWSTSVLLTLPKNKLIAFPELSTSSYASYLEIGKSLNQARGYKYNGVDPETGVYTFLDIDGKPTTTPDPLKDQVPLGSLDPKFYGSFRNTITISRFEIDIFFEFRKQPGSNYLNSLPSQGIGRSFLNYPTTVLDRWQKPGDQTEFERYSWAVGSPAYDAATTFFSRVYTNSARYSDASFIRLKNAAIYYSFNPALLQRIHVKNLKCYVTGNNLLTITSYRGTDPETQNLYKMPPLRTIVAGIQVTL
ncbi:SusC/RagA family TonB-linked outer membrane protein [Niastella sp. OAS944]|uniref:SusC/RagA family TonB-linked outer membrane protein n=1 Tax=Niastella sp. OAS944 TaxID=2664089 RepID=UPI0035C7BC22|nr:TonB-linked SusC/RagA family outer membrane protein [Chitinophagaceae bacterium OAS944]